MLGNAVHVMRIATGEIEDTIKAPDSAKEYMRKVPERLVNFGPLVAEQLALSDRYRLELRL